MRGLTAFLLILCLLAVPAMAENNLLKNGDFETVDASGLPDHWTRELWYLDEGVSELAAAQGVGEMGASAIRVENFSPNDAGFEQTVAVEPNTVYRIACLIRAEGCGLDEQGATLSIKNTFVSTPSLYDTNGVWTPVTLYGKTASDQRELTVQARVGGYGSLNVGLAYFDDLEVVAVDEAEAGGAVKSLATLPPVTQSNISDEEIEMVEALGQPSDWTFLLIAVGLLFVLLSALLLVLAGRGAICRLDDAPQHPRVFAALFLIALGVRLLIAACVRGYGVDMSCFEGWAYRMTETGPSAFYTAEAFCDYPPGYMYVLWGIGSILRALHASFDGSLAWALIKLPSILLDCGCAAALYYAARKQYGVKMATLLGGIMLFNPAGALNSAAWGQIDAVLTALLVLSLLEASRGRWILSLPIYAVAVLVKPQALMFAPLGLAVVVLEIVSSERKGRAALRFLGIILLSLALMVALSYPFLRNLPDDLTQTARSLTLFGYVITINIPPSLAPLNWLIGQYGGTIGSYSCLSVNACNLYTLFNMNWVPLADAPATSLFAWIMFALSYGYTIFLYVKARDRGKVFLTAATLLALVFAFGPMMHERYLFPVLALLPIAYAFDRDARILVAFLLFSFTEFMNMGLVLTSEHLLASQQALNAALSLLNVVGAMFLAWTAFEVCVYDRAVSFTRKYKKSADAARQSARVAARMEEGLYRTRGDARLGLRRKDYFFLIVLTVAAACLAFINLGSTEAPQTQWRSSAAGEQITFDLGAKSDFHIAYFGGISSSTFLVQTSEDGQVWSEAHYARYNLGEIFHWRWYSACEKDGENFYELESGYPMQSARYVRLTAERAGLILNEVAFLNADGEALPVASIYALGGREDGAYNPRALIDEQDTVPPYPSYLNGMYFDEIYHGRTAYEHLNGLIPYEYTHPPLGKVLIMIGIKLFGMTPFGWRFMPALFGVLMIPLMYLLCKQLFKRSSYALIAAFLMLVDCMHFVQSRLATIDVFAVFFIMLMYLFMFRYAQMSFYHQKLWRTLVPLGISGVSMGLAIACKWIGIYGAIGLAVIFFYTLIRRFREYRYARKNLKSLDSERKAVAQRAIRTFWRCATVTLLFCLLAFILLPALIYYFSYYWHLAPEGGLSLAAVASLQRAMLSYHAGVSANAHYFASKWYEWPLITQPIWYYSGTEFLPDGMISSISCLGNPVVWWGGTLAMILLFVRLFMRRTADNKAALFIAIGFLSQYLPWVLIPRCTFIYHFFASVPFIILATVALFETIRKKDARVYHAVAIVYCGAALLLFGAFFPIMSGLPIPKTYARYLDWFNWYIFEP